MCSDVATADEYLAVLSAKHLTGVMDDDKSRQDCYNLGKTLTRMLLHLQSKVHNSPQDVHRMRVSGILEHVFSWQVLTVQMTGHVTVMRISDRSPYPTTPEDLHQWLKS